MRKVASLVHRELAVLLHRKLHAPGSRYDIPADLTIRSVVMNRDLRNADVYVSLPVTAGCKWEQADEELQRASGYLRACLASRLSIKSVPRLRFRHDDRLETAEWMHTLIDRALRTDDKRRVSG